MEQQTCSKPDFSNAGAPLRRSSLGYPLKWKASLTGEIPRIDDRFINVVRDRCEESDKDTSIDIQRCFLELGDTQFLACLKTFYYPVTIEFTLEYVEKGNCFTKSNVILKLFHRNNSASTVGDGLVKSNTPTEADGSTSSGRSTIQSTPPPQISADNTMMFESPDELDAIVAICDLEIDTREEALRFVIDNSLGVDTIRNAEVQGHTLKHLVQSSTRMPELAKVLCKAWM